MATVYREIFICVLFLLSLSASGFKTGQISMFQLISLQAQLCLGKFKTGQNCSQEGRNNTGRK